MQFFILLLFTVEFYIKLRFVQAVVVLAAWLTHGKCQIRILCDFKLCLCQAGSAAELSHSLSGNRCLLPLLLQYLKKFAHTSYK